MNTLIVRFVLPSRATFEEKSQKAKRVEEMKKKKAKSKAQKMVVSSKSKANKNKAKDALPPRAVVADKGFAGEKSEYILRRARVVPQRVRGMRLSLLSFSRYCS